ncbi:hypothetical protein [Streptomyces roseoverticillatus]|uniref:hypothetical protein n=1 Tax=Streptomyces roseoverticillatus TaxID=66429 RepID=UPI0012FF0659|nr:hypothetical protein [Streptomyces roseoverticillatus]
MSPSTTARQLQVDFRDDLTPSLAAGTYTIEAAHTVAVGPQGGAEPLPVAEQPVVVDAPRFGLDPQKVLGVYPPADTAGSYQLVLPHITVRSASLPWARRIGGDRQPAKGEPWLAVMLVTEHDLREDPTRKQFSPVRPVAEVAGTARQKGPVLLPLLGDLPPAAAGTACRTIDVKRDALGELLPRRNELPFLAHVRDVKIVAAQADSTYQAVERKLEEGRFGVVIGNRFPRSQGVRYTAHLVSLEGHGTYDFLQGPTRSTTFEAVRFVSLWSWSFECTAKAADFQALAKGLLKSAKKEPSLRLPTPASSGKEPVHERVRQRRAHGYVALASRLPSGEETTAWYRGPFTPSPAQGPGSNPPPLPSAASSLIYVKEDGVFDTSYACAFEAGRLLALANIDLATALGRARGKAMSAMQRLVAAVAVDGGVGGTGPALSRFRKLLTADDVGARITSGLGRKGSVPEKTVSVAAGDPGGSEGDWTAALSALLRDGPGEQAPDSHPSEDAVLNQAYASVLAQTADDVSADLAAAGSDRAKLLDAVPFHFLVPNLRMLPPESLRLFHVDRHWLDALRAGALSLGIATSLDRHLARRLLEIRDGQRAPVMGMLVRSALISHWPELTCEVSRKEPDPHLKLFTRRPAPDVLLLLFTGRPDRVVLSEPPQALSFGIDSTEGNGTLHLRRVTAAGADKGVGTPAGALAGVYACTRGPAASTGAAPSRSTEVLNIDDRAKPPPEGRTLVQVMEALLRKDGGLSPEATLTPAGLGLQFFNGAQKLIVNTAVGGDHG